MSKKVKYASNFLANAPPGEYEICINDLKQIASESTVNQARNETKVQWHENNYFFTIVQDHGAVICADARQPDGSYLDPHSGYLFNFDFDTKKVTTTTSKGPAQNPICEDLLPALDAYAAASYKDKSFSGCYTLSDGSISIILRSSSTSLSNCRTGAVYARYVLQTNGTFTGTIKSIQHFFENGNALSEFSSDLQTKIKMGDSKSVTRAIIHAIDDFEQNWLDAANTAFEKVGEEALFKLRRKFPVTHTKIQWERELTPGSFIA